eukprot:400148-Rhodomonas_salina.5
MPLSVAFNPSLTSGVRAAPDERQPAQELIIASPVRYHQPARLDHASPGTWTSPAPRQSPREMPVAESPKLEVSSADGAAAEEASVHDDPRRDAAGAVGRRHGPAPPHQQGREASPPPRGRPPGPGSSLPSVRPKNLFEVSVIPKGVEVMECTASSASPCACCASLLLPSCVCVAEHAES